MNRKEIEKSIIQTITSLESSITFFGLGGVLKAVVAAVSAVVDELFYDINRVKRSLFKATAPSDDLDNLGTDCNTPRLEEAYAGAVLVFSGTASTVIPAGTQVRSSAGIVFETVESITLGQANPGYDLYPSEPLGDKVEAIALTAGTQGNVPALTITSLVTPISGVDYVTNPSPAIGGQDTEPDNQYRVRLMERINLLNQGTLAFYEAVTKEINSEILRVYACRGESEREISIYVATRSGTGLTTIEKNVLQESIRNYAPICANPVVYNVTFTDIDVYAKISLQPNYTLSEVFTKLLINLADLIDWSKDDFGAEINYADILVELESTEGVKNVDINSFMPNSDTVCAANSIPKLGTVTLINLNDESDTVNYSPATTYIYQYN
jgi:uncharacterized phage protein gp47/JayE